jgi:putative PIN family toxin of toxin-antitoxin system
VRVFLDTNVLASALATRGLCTDLFELVLQGHELLVSEPVLRELERVLPGKLGLSKSVTDGFTSLLRAEALLITAEHPFPTLPDPDDEAIIASALAGKADVFVTGDKALLELQRIEKLPVMSPRQFWGLLAAKI